MSDTVYIVVRYLPLPCDVAVPRPARRESRHDPLLDLAFLRFVIDPFITPDEEQALRRLCAARLPVVIPGLETVA